VRIQVRERAFELALQVRSYEVGRDGCLRPANIVRYFEYLATEDSADRGFDHTWYERTGSAWVVREMRLRLGQPPGIGERLRMATWVSSYGRVQAYREYVLWRAASGVPVARAQARWGYIDRASGRPTRVPEELSARIVARGEAMSPWTLHEPDAGERTVEAEPTELSVVAREVEADSQQHVNNAVYLDWLEELSARQFQAAPRLQTLLPRWRRISLEYVRPALPGDTMQLASRVSRASDRALDAAYEITAGGERGAVLRARVRYLLARSERCAVRG
jgi:acyl-CoA thioesterase FadM